MATEKSGDRVIIVVWRWSQSKVFGLNEKDEWRTAEGDVLVRTDIRKAGQDWCKMLIDMIAAYAKDKPVLLLLHSTEPHHYTENDVQTLHNALATEGRAKRPVRIRRFGGGKEAVYFTKHSKKGVVGRDGYFPTEIKEYEPELLHIQSELVVDEGASLINSDHIEHVWKNYWRLPHKAVYTLAEQFSIRADGYDPTGGKAFVAILREDDLFWQRLCCFAGLIQAGNMDHHLHDYDLALFEHHLRASGNTTLLEQIRKSREELLKLLDSETGTAAPLQTISNVFSALFRLFKQISAEPL
jgi:hypothetical protein